MARGLERTLTALIASSTEYDVYRIRLHWEHTGVSRSVYAFIGCGTLRPTGWHIINEITLCIALTSIVTSLTCVTRDYSIE